MKAEFAFLDQMIRMIDSFISKQVDSQKLKSESSTLGIYGCNR